MSIITLKSKIKSVLESIDVIQQVEDYPTIDFNGYPAVAVRSDGNTSRYETTCDNEEIYSFTLFLYYPIDNDVKTQRKGRSIIEETCDTIRDTFDNDEFLDGISLPADRLMIGVRPTVSVIGEEESGKFVGAEIELAIRISKNINL